MPFTIPEALADLPEAIALFNSISAEVAKLPATGRKAADYGKVIVAVTPALCTLIDEIEAQVKS